VQGVVDVWNAVMTAQRNLVVQEAQREAAIVLDEGTFEEYRAGLRSTFDVLFAHGALRDSEIALVATRRELYVAQATLLRQIGLLEVGTILSQTPLYDPTINTRHAAERSSTPIDPVIRSLDRLLKSEPNPRELEQPALPAGTPAVNPANPMPRVGRATTPDLPPLPGTVGTPVPAQNGPRKTKRP